MMGVHYLTGTGVEQDFAKAVHFLRRAAEKGDAGGMFNLGICYSAGKGVEKNMQEAVRWVSAAAEKGHAEAKKFLQALQSDQREK